MTVKPKLSPDHPQIRILLRHIRVMRGQMNPKVLRRLEQAVWQNPPPWIKKILQEDETGKQPVADSKMVPYDREAAQLVVRKFLATRHDGGRFQSELIDKLKNVPLSGK